MQGMVREVSDKFGYGIKNIVPFKDAYMIETSQGQKLIKRVQISPGRLIFVHNAKEHLVNNGFTGVDRYLCTLSGDPYFAFDNCCYAVVDMIKGKESSFDDDNDLMRSASLLAGLHKASAGYLAPAGCKVKNELGKMPVYFRKRLDDIRKMIKKAKKKNSLFDQLFLKYVDYFYEAGETAYNDLLASSYWKLVDKFSAEKGFCHHDYNHHNIYFSGESATVANFEYCCHELRVYDIANLIRRKMRKCDWSFSKAEMIINSYNTIVNVDKDEMEVLRSILLFPQKFWRVVNRYYNSRRSWSERSYLATLQEALDEIEPHAGFIKEFSSYFL